MANLTWCTVFGPDSPESDFPSYYVTLMKLNSFLITLLNTQVLVCLSVKRKLFTGNYWAQVVCLSSSDILSGIGIWIMTTIEYKDVKTSLTLCSLAHLINIIAQIATLINVLWICIRRFWGIRKLELPDKTRSTFDVFIQMMVVWILSTSYCILPFIIWTKKDCNLQGCSFSTLFGNSYYKAVGFLFSGLFLPLILTNVIYVAIMLKLRKLLQQVRPLIENKQSKPQPENNLNNDVFVTNSIAKLHVCKPTGRVEINNSKTSSYLSDLGYQTRSPSCGRVDSNDSNKETTRTLPSQIVSTNDRAKLPSCLKAKTSLTNTRTGDHHQLFITDAHKMTSTRSTESGTLEINQMPGPSTQYLGKIRTVALSKSKQALYKKDNQITQTKSFEIRLRRQRRSMMIIGFILVLLNMFTWPSAIISALSLSPSLYITYEHKVVLLGLVTMNSLINPFVYSLTIPEFRKAIKDLYFDCYHFFVTLCSR